MTQESNSLALVEIHMIWGNFVHGGMAVSVQKQKNIQPKILRENGDLSRTAEKQPGAGMKKNSVWRRAVI